MSDSSDNQGKLLLDLYQRWESLLRERCNARTGTQARSELDGVYFRTLPTIVAITEAIDDREVIELVHLAGTLLSGGGRGDQKVLTEGATSGRGQ